MDRSHATSMSPRSSWTTPEECSWRTTISRSEDTSSKWPDGARQRRDRSTGLPVTHGVNTGERMAGSESRPTRTTSTSRVSVLGVFPLLTSKWTCLLYTSVSSSLKMSETIANVIERLDTIVNACNRLKEYLRRR